MSDERKPDSNSAEVTEISISEMAERIAVEDREQESQILEDLGLSSEGRSGYQAFQEAAIGELSQESTILLPKGVNQETHVVTVDRQASRVGRSINLINHPDLRVMQSDRAGDWGRIVEIRARLTTRGRQAVKLALEEKAA